MAEEQRADVQPQHEEAVEEVKDRGLKEKIEEHFHGGHDSSSSDSDNEKLAAKPAPHPVAHPAESSLKDKVFRLFGRERPVHHVLGGGKPADVLLWRNKKISAGVLGGATAIWILFELLEYHLITLIAHSLIFVLAALFLYSNGRTFIHKSPPRIPEVSIPEDQVVNVVLSLRYDINKTFAVLREIALGRELKKFLVVIAGLWILSVIGTWTDFLTLFYILFVMLHTVPVLYEKYDDKVDAFAEKILAELKKHYAVVDAKVISKIPRGPLKNKKH